MGVTVDKRQTKPWSKLERRVLAAGLLLLSAILIFALEWSYGLKLPSSVWLVLVGLAAAALASNAHQSATVAQITEPVVEPQQQASEPPWNGEERRRSQLILAAASHELRTPLNAIVGFSELLRDAEHNNAGRKAREEYAQTILDNAKLLQHLFNEVLDANRLESGVLQLAEQDCDLAEIIEIVTRARHDAAGERGVTIIARVAEGLLCRGDSNRLRQALSCVVDNAIKFSPTDGIININMLRGPKGQLVMSVTDAGKGISVEDMGRLFNPFRQLDEGAARHHGGLGLGLFIARGILRLHGGDVTLTSSPEKGTEVWLVLPAGRINWKTLQQPHDEATTAKRVA